VDADVALVADTCRAIAAAEGPAAVGLDRLLAAVPRLRWDAAGRRWEPVVLDARAVVDGFRSWRGEPPTVRGGDPTVDMLLEHADSRIAAEAGLARRLPDSRLVSDAAMCRGAATLAASPGRPGIWVGGPRPDLPRAALPDRKVLAAVQAGLAGLVPYMGAARTEPDELASPDFLMPPLVVAAATAMRAGELRCCLVADDALPTGYAVSFIDAPEGQLEAALADTLRRLPSGGGRVALAPLLAAYLAWLDRHGLDTGGVARVDLAISLRDE
jgi:hypothetical protein